MKVHSLMILVAVVRLFGSRSPVRRKAALTTFTRAQEVRLPRGREWGKSWPRTIEAGCGMLLVTGGAGFIGSNVVAALNDAGRTDVAVCDVLGSEGKWRNLAKRQFAAFVPPAELESWLKGRRLEAVIHLGAISSTTAADGDHVIETNFNFPMRL